MKRNKLKSIALIFLILAAPALMLMGYGGFLHSPNNPSAETAQKLPEGTKITKLANGWTKTEVIFNESTGNAYVPEIAVDQAGNIHVVWSDETDYNGAGTDVDIFYRCWNVTTSTWSPIEVISFEYSEMSYGASIAVDMYGQVHVVWSDWTDHDGAGTDRDIFYERLNITAGTWTPTTVVSNVSSDHSISPAIAVDVHGNAHVVWEDEWNYNDSGTDPDIFYRSWNATMDTWTRTRVLSNGSDDISSRPSLATNSNGNVHVVWEEWLASWNNVFYRCWNATTDTWSSAELISTESQDDCWEPQIVADGAGHVHVIWREYVDAIMHVCWNATTGNWTTTALVSVESTSVSVEPAIATDFKGNIHVAWRDNTDFDGAGPDNDIVYKCWNATTATWTSMELISTESTSSSSNPTIVVDGTGCVYVAWDDDTNYNGAGTDHDIFYKKTVWLPQGPVLASIVPNPDIDGMIELNWSKVADATIYYIYRATSSIESVDGLNSIGTSFTNNYTDRVTTNGIYYYVIVAGNASGNSSISNCEWVEVIISFAIPGFELYWGMIGILVLVVLARPTKRKIRRD